MTARGRLRNRQRHRRAVRKHFDAGLPWLDFVRHAPRWLSRQRWQYPSRFLARERHAMSKRTLRNLQTWRGPIRPTAWNRWRPDVVPSVRVVTHGRAWGWSMTHALGLGRLL